MSTSYMYIYIYITVLIIMIICQKSKVYILVRYYWPYYFTYSLTVSVAFTSHFASRWASSSCRRAPWLRPSAAGLQVEPQHSPQASVPHESESGISWVISHVPIEHHPTIRYMVYNGYYKVMSNIPKMGHLPTPGFYRHFLRLKNGQELLWFAHLPEGL